MTLASSEATCGTVGDDVSQLVSVDRKLPTLAPYALGGTPFERRPAPQAVQDRSHVGAVIEQVRLAVRSVCDEPGAVLAVLALELAVVPGVARRSVERQDAPALEERGDRWSAVAARPVEAQDQRRAMLGEVGLERSRDVSGVVAVGLGGHPKPASDGHLKTGQS